MLNATDNNLLLDALYLGAALSLGLLVMSLLLIPPLLCRIPSNYFNRPAMVGRGANDRRSVRRWALWLLRNIAAALLVAAGIAMLILPGQGLLTILAGLFVADFPGKFALQRRLIANESLFKAINWVRKKQGVAPLQKIVN